MSGLLWSDVSVSGTVRLDWLDLPEATPDTLEALAGMRGDWEYEPETGWNWWGIGGTFNGAVFTLYTHKSGTIKIGGYPEEGLDIAGLRAALKAALA